MPSLPLLRAADLRRIEAVAADQPLMERAGRAAAELAAKIDTGHGAVLVLAGPGNNGGDAFEAARLLRQRFFETRVVFAGQPDKLPKDANAAYQRFVEAGGTTLERIPDNMRWSSLIDGLFGIGLARDISGHYVELVEKANALAERYACPLIALDCPTGLDADTGARRGATIRATHTISFIAAKPGLFTGDGPDHCGEIHVAALDLNPAFLAEAPGKTIDRQGFAAQLKPRRRNSHKGSFGCAGILGGATGMVGAALLAGRAALRLGSGLVQIGLLDEHAPGVDPQQAELMLRTPEKLLTGDLNRFNALACGPGMGRSPLARTLLESACRIEQPIVLDADALNLVAEDGDLQVALAIRTAATLLTPHPAEAARLLDCDIATVQADRIGAACELATHYRANVALKGCGTVVATPSGQWFINTTGNPGLATAGSGDVLTGVVTALLTQGWPPLEALLAGVHLHACAADRLVAQGCGPIGLTAGELIDSARGCLNEWISESRAN